jgi:glycosyltransferase involved in cell wall biosynthesis
MTPLLPGFSIITCTRNSEPWLDDSIASVLGQEAVDVEYIFVDGQSTDGTLSRIHRIERPIKLVENRCAGISDAMNAGLALATHEIVAFLHSDDFYLHADVLKIVAESFRTTRCQWLFGRTLSAINDQLIPEGYTAPRYSRRQLLRGNFIPHPACFVKRSLLLQAGDFNTKLRYAMDYDLWLRLSLLADPLEINKPLTAFREHAGSLSTRERSAAMREDLQVRLAHTGFNPVNRLTYTARYFARRWRDGVRAQAHEVSHA